MENINWKEVSQSEGYKSLKAAYCRYVQRWPKQKPDSYRSFQSALTTCKRLAHKEGKSLTEVLNYHETKRTYNYRNYYNNLRTVQCPPVWSGEQNSIKYALKYLKSYSDSQAHKRAQARVIDIKQSYAANRREAVGRKPRWHKSRRR